MKKHHLPPYIYLLFITVLLASCSTGNKFACSFGKRRYTKGFYINMPGKIAAVSKHIPALSISPVPSVKALPLRIAGEQNIKTTLLSVPGKPSLASCLSSVVIHKKLLHNNSSISSGGAADDNNKSKKSEINFAAIVGFAFSTTGSAIAAIDGFLPILAIVFLVAGAALCVYALTRNEIYWTWMAVLGLSFIVILFTLILL